MKQINFNENKIVNYENQEKKKFEGITKLKNNYRKYSNFAQEEKNDKNSENGNINTSYNFRNKQNNEKANKSGYENSNLKDRSYSPITHRRNQYVDEYVNVKISGTDNKEQMKKFNYFEEFNVFNYLIFLFFF